MKTTHLVSDQMYFVLRLRLCSLLELFVRRCLEAEKLETGRRISRDGQEGWTQEFGRKDSKPAVVGAGRSHLGKFWQFGRGLFGFVLLFLGVFF